MPGIIGGGVGDPQPFVVTNMSERPETVFTVHDWYDGPRSGAANFEGAPFWYRSVYSDTEQWNPEEDRFELTPLSPEALGWEVDRDSIFHRWDAARKAGAVIWKDGDTENFGALPEERGRYRHLNQSMESYLTTHSVTILARGSFELGCKQVRWKPLRQIAGPEPGASPDGGPATGSGI